MRKTRWFTLMGLLTGLALADGHDHEAKTRLVLADEGGRQVLVLDPGKGEVTGRFTYPFPVRLYPLPDGEHVLVVAREAGRVSFLFSGLALEDHGDHKDLKEEPPYVLATLRTGPQPTHVFAHGAHLAVFHDGDGSVALFDLRRLGLDLGFTQVATGRPDHGAVALLGNLLLVGGLESGRVEAYTLRGNRVLELKEACPQLHGEAVLGERAAFGCLDGVLLVERRGQGVVARKLLSPPGAPEGVRVGTLTAHLRHPYFVGNFGEGLVFIFPEGRMEPLPLTARPLRFAFDPEGEALYALTADGKLHRIDPKARRVTGSLQLVEAWKQGEPRPDLALGHGKAYLTDPKRGEVVAVDLKAFQEEARFKLGGTPTWIVVLEVFGEEH